MTDEDFYDIYSKEYKLENLNNTLVDGEMKRFYDIDLKNFIRMDEFLKENLKKEDDNFEVPSFVKDALSSQENLSNSTLNAKLPEGYELYNIDGLINFDDINCVFYNTENIYVIGNVLQVMQEVPRGITAIKADDTYQPYTLRMLAAVDETGIYKNIVPITCHDDMKYSPYSFFRELVCTIFEYSASPRLAANNDFSIFNQADPKGLIKDLITLKQRPMGNPDEIRDAYYTVFLSLLQSIPDTLIYIENFEKIDDASLYVLSLLFENFEDTNISYLVSYDSNYSLHKKLHFLLSRPYYTEITLLPSQIQNIIAGNEKYYENIITDFYFLKIVKYAIGSALFIDYGIQYLIECGVYAEVKNKLEMINPKTVIIPSTLDQLIQRRLNIMKDDLNLITFLASCVLLGTRVDFNTVAELGFKNWMELAQKLENSGYLYFFNNCIYFPNYSILRENVLAILDDKIIVNIGKLLFEKVFTAEMPSPLKALFYDKFKHYNEVVEELEKLANINLSMGDFSAYLNCSAQIIKKLDSYSKNWSPEDLKKYKISIYENIAQNLFEYKPDQTREIADKTLDDLYKNGEVKSFSELCPRMIQGAIDNGEYLYALNLTHKMLATLNGGSIDPSCANFNMDFLVMSLIHIKILFGIGAYSDCIDIGYNILNVIDSAKIKTLEYTSVTEEDLKYLLLEAIAYVALAGILSLREDMKEFLDIVNKLFDFIPPEYAIFIQLQNLITGNQAVLSEEIKGQNIFSNLIFHIINAFQQYKNDANMFAKEIYKAKRIAQDAYMLNFELFCDLLIGYAYIKLNSHVKAAAIINQVLKTASEKGINVLKYIGSYILSIMYIDENKFDTAYGLLNNSAIGMEKNIGSNDLLTLLNKINLYKIFKNSGAPDKAQNCLEQAKYIITKYKLNFELNIDN